MDYKPFMKQCIELAKLGSGNVSPNPLVGCVVLDKDNNIISTGYHHYCGGNHAERDALLKLTSNEAENGTLIVNLEPCSHYGKTPPCADFIIEKHLKRVVIGMRDVNPIVAGKGIKKLKDAGIEVIEGILENECRQLNEVFIKNMSEHKTFVAIKTATTLDGKIATSIGDSKWITSDLARDEVKNIRKRYDAILTSSGTVIADNPTMAHKKKIIVDRELKTNFEGAKIYKEGEIYVFYDEALNPPAISNIHFIKSPVTNNKIFPEFILKKLYELGIMSVLVEAGGHMNGSFLDYADKIYQFIAPKIIGDNSAKSAYDYRQIDKISDAKKFTVQEIQQFPPDFLVILK